MAASYLEQTSGAVPSTPNNGLMRLWNSASKIWGSLDDTGASAAISAQQWIALTSSYPFTVTTTSVQKLFNATTNGALALLANTTYFFESQFSVTGMSAGSGNLKFDPVGPGTVGVGSIAWSATGMDSTTVATAAAVGGSFSITNSSTGDIVTAGAGTAVYAMVKGILRATTTGTIIPSVALTTAGAAIVQINSWFRIWGVGANTDKFGGGWT